MSGAFSPDPAAELSASGKPSSANFLPPLDGRIDRELGHELRALIDECASERTTDSAEGRREHHRASELQRGLPTRGRVDDLGSTLPGLGCEKILPDQLEVADRGIGVVLLPLSRIVLELHRIFSLNIASGFPIATHLVEQSLGGFALNHEVRDGIRVLFIGVARLTDAAFE